MASSTSSKPQKPTIHHHLKKAVLEFFGIPVDTGDIATLGIVGILLLVWRQLFAPKPGTGSAIDTRGLIDEALWDSAMIFFRDSGKCLYKGSWCTLARIDRANGMPKLEGNGSLIADFLEGIANTLEETDPTLPAKLREYMFGLLFSGTDAAQKVDRWINTQVAAQNGISDAPGRWNQIAQGDPTTKRFLAMARRVQAIIEQNHLVEKDWRKAYDRVALELIAKQQIKLSPQHLAKNRVLKWLEISKATLQSPNTALLLLRGETAARNQAQAWEEKSAWLGMVAIGLIIAILILAFIGANMSPKKDVSPQNQHSEIHQ